MSDTTKQYFIKHHNRQVKVTVCPQLGCSITATSGKAIPMNRQETANVLRFARRQMNPIKKIGILL